MRQRRPSKRSDPDVKEIRHLLDTGVIGDVMLHQDLQEIATWVEAEEEKIEDRKEARDAANKHVAWAFKKLGRPKGKARPKAVARTDYGTPWSTTVPLSAKVPEYIAKFSPPGGNNGDRTGPPHGHVEVEVRPVRLLDDPGANGGPPGHVLHPLEQVLGGEAGRKHA
jgi:hypothetical protein